MRLFCCAPNLAAPYKINMIALSIYVFYIIMAVLYVDGLKEIVIISDATLIGKSYLIQNML